MNLLDDILITKDIKLFEEDRLRHCYNICEELILDSIPDNILKSLYNGYERDIDKVLNNIVKETYRILYGRFGNLKPTIKDVSELDEFVEDELRKQDLSYFAQTALNGFQINWHHLEWGLLALYYNFIAILAARDHGKSYYWSLAYPLWRAYK